MKTKQFIRFSERTSHAEGRIEGRNEAAVEMATKQLRKKFGELSPEQTSAISARAETQLYDLGEALLDFVVPGELDVWLRENPPKSVI
jgi:hypothetical protein